MSDSVRRPEQAGPSSNSQLGFTPEILFPDFEWKEGSAPKSLTINNAGFPVDPEGFWYLSRRASGSGLTVADAQDLHLGNKRSWINGTQGAGLYFANYPLAVEKVTYVGKKSKMPSELYVARIQPEPEATFDSTDKLRGKRVGLQTAGLILRTLAVNPFMPWPTPGLYDRMYGNTKLVIFTPSAIQRRPSATLNIDGTQIKPRYALVRDYESLEIMAHKSLNAS